MTTLRWDSQNGSVLSLKNLWGLAVVLMISVLIFSLLRLGTTFELGDDEGLALIKGFMCNRGYKLYTEIWNDQPPLFTVLLSGAFRTWSPSILTARLVAAGFGLLLIGAFHELVRQRSGKGSALIATFLLLASPGVLILSVSVMLEVPAFATALLSAWLLFEWGKWRHWAWLLASGVVMALALQIKLSAVLILPAIGVEFLLMLASARHHAFPERNVGAPARPDSRGKEAQKQTADHRGHRLDLIRASPGWLLRRPASVRVLLWVTPMVAVTAVIGMTWGKGSLAPSWKSHTTAQAVQGFDRPEDHKFEVRLLRNHAECWAAAALCLTVALRQKGLRQIAFPSVLLLVVSAVHAVHRPWWNYYYLHLAIPLAWLAGWTVNESIRLVHTLVSTGRINVFSRAAWKAVAVCALAAAALARSETRLEGAIKGIRQRTAAATNPIVNTMKACADQTAWVYARSPIYAFHAGLPVPPELAVVTPKRFWSGQITVEAIVETCSRYKPELLVLPLTGSNTEWKLLLDREYALAATDAKNALYVALRIKEKTP